MGDVAFLRPVELTAMEPERRRLELGLPFGRLASLAASLAGALAFALFLG